MAEPQGNVLLSANQWRLMDFGATMVLDWAIHLRFPEFFVTNIGDLCLDHYTTFGVSVDGVKSFFGESV